MRSYTDILLFNEIIPVNNYQHWLPTLATINVKSLKRLFLGLLVIVILYCFVVQPTGLRRVYHNSEPESRLSLEDENEKGCPHETQDSSNETESRPRILCVILTTFSTYRVQASTVHQVWASRCDQTVYFTAKLAKNTNYNLSGLISNITGKNLLLDIVPLKRINAEDYQQLTRKMIEVFKYVYRNLRPRGKRKEPLIRRFDWLLKADEDTFIIYENLKWFLGENCNYVNNTFGYTRKGIYTNGTMLAKSGFHVGGAGYTISYHAMKRFGHMLIKNKTFCQSVSGNEDLDIADCLDRLGIVPGNSRDSLGRERFHSENYDNHWILKYPSMTFESIHGFLLTGLMCCSNTSISFHHLSPDDMFKFYNLVYNVKPITFR